MQIVVNEIILGLIAGLGCLVGGILLLPSLATDELREVLADVIQTCGMSISGYASRIFPPEEVHPADATEQTPVPWSSVYARHWWITHIKLVIKTLSRVRCACSKSDLTCEAFRQHICRAPVCTCMW